MSIAINLPDRNSESRKILWAVLASLFIHLLVAFSLATFSGKLAPLPEVEDKPAELTIVNVMPTPAPIPKNARFMETHKTKESAQAPKEKTFESNANSIAASQIPADGDSLLPSQEGKDRPFTNLETQDASIGLEAQPPIPTPASSASATPKPSPTPPMTPTPPRSTPTPPPLTPTPPPPATPAPDQLAMLMATPPPALTPSEELAASPTPESAMPTPTPRATEQPESSYRPYLEQTRTRGSITNRGASAVNAVGTPLGRYQKMIYDAIGSRWLYYTKKQMSLISIGNVHVAFSIDRDGRLQNLKMLSNSSNEAFANVCLESIQQSKAPPIPEDVVDVLPPEGLVFEISFTFFPN
jgi:outer membrane biosynthesis protein TonB